MEENVSVNEQTTPFSEIAESGINANTINLLGLLRKYIMVTQLQIDLYSKPINVQHIMKEIYHFNETNLVMDIRTNFNMIYAYTQDKTVTNNYESVRTKFEDAIQFITQNVIEINNNNQKAFIEIYDTFCEKLKHIADVIANKSIYREDFVI